MAKSIGVLSSDTTFPDSGSAGFPPRPLACLCCASAGALNVKSVKKKNVLNVVFKAFVVF